MAVMSDGQSILSGLVFKCRTACIYDSWGQASMCGIAGIVDWSGQDNGAIVHAMNTALTHRGPDASGVRHLGEVTLGHRRLSIIDLSSNNDQPLSDSTGSIWITFNGEIYNFRELRVELEAKGSIFKTKGDTEVLLEAYKHWGENFLQRLVGMFAIALWDSNQKKLLLARDRAGEKPLYVAELEHGGLAFASEVKALRLHPAIPRSIDQGAVAHFLRINYITGGPTLFKGIRRLDPATCLVLHLGKPQRSFRYWDISQNFLNKRQFSSDAEASQELGALIDQAVSRQMISDVPLGAFLSGGMDSSTIVASMVKSSPSHSVQTCSVGFNENCYSEVEEARAVARYLGLDHIDETLMPDAGEVLRILNWASDVPIADTSFLPTYLLSECTRKNVKVALSGDGGDELYGGYETYSADIFHRYSSWISHWGGGALLKALSLFAPVSFGKVSFDYKLRKFVDGLSFDAHKAHFSWRTIFSAREIDRMLRPEWHVKSEESDPYQVFSKHFSEVQGCHYLDQAMYVDLKTWLTDDILVKVDRASMAHGLEVRAPFLDHELMEFSASLPVEMKIRCLRKKHLLKESQRNRLPSWVLKRKKSGFNSPISQWLNGPLEDLARSTLSTPAVNEIFEPREMQRLWDEHRSMKRDNGLHLLSLFVLALQINSAAHQTKYG